MPAVTLASEDIYDALADDESFARLPARIARAFGGRSCVIGWHYPAGGAEILSHSGPFTERQVGLYTLKFAARDAVEELLPGVDGKSVFRNALMPGIGDEVFRSMGVRITNPWGVGYIAVQRERSGEAFDDELVAAFDRNAAGLRRMLSMRGRLAAMKRRVDSLQSTLDQFGRGVLLVSPDGVLLHANKTGEELLRRGDALTLKKGVVAANSPEAASALRQAIERACLAQSVEGGALLVGRPGQRPMAVLVIPVRDRPFSRSALLIAGGECTRNELLPRLQALYRLTPAEAEIATGIGEGVSPAQIARDRGVSVATVRSQIKALANKLGVKRQSEISALVNALPPLTAEFS